MGIISPSEWEQVKALLEEALRLEPEKVLPFLDRAAPDEGVRREVERLLVFRCDITGFLSAPVPQEIMDLGVPHRLKLGAVLCKRFQIVRFIAAGGMGEIYEARDQELQERVAIKTIRQDFTSQPASL